MPRESPHLHRLDIHQAFYRIRLKESVEDLTTFRTLYGSCKYQVLPFGLYNGPASFSVTLIRSCLTTSTISTRHTLMIS